MDRRYTDRESDRRTLKEEKRGGSDGRKGEMEGKTHDKNSIHFYL